MNEFLLKSTITMATLLGLYYLLFEREKMHRFNRFYLLSALVFSFVLPFITVITYIREINVSNELATISDQPINTTATEPINYLLYLGWTVYAVITIILLIRFVKNVSYFIKKATANPSIKKGQMTLVLLEEKTLPHTFLNYVFVNKEDYELKMIEEELYTHEYTHIIQKHTLDILFIEALKTIFWFNPLLYFYKKAIQLNHEFLADEKVINTTANTIYYQNLLLEKANVGKTFSIASNLNFSLTKKRFIMMTKTTTAVKANFLKAAIAPVLVTLMALLCTKTVAQEKTKVSLVNSEDIKSVEVTTVTKKQLDSLQKIDPVKYKGNESDFLKTKMRYADKKGSQQYTESFDKKNDYTLDLSGAVKTDPSQIKSIEINQLTQTEMDALKKHDSVTYNDVTLKDYSAIRITQVNDQGRLETITTYEKKP